MGYVIYLRPYKQYIRYIDYIISHAGCITNISCTKIYCLYKQYVTK